MITLYKYRPFNDYIKPIITIGRIWFPTRASLNDPEDLLLNLINDLDAEAYPEFLLRKARRETWGCDQLEENLNRCLTPEGNLTPEAIQKAAGSRAMLQKYFDRLGILSLSDQANSPLLWERYGGAGRGVCIAVEVQPTDFLMKVEYRTPRPQLRLSSLLLGDDPEKQIRKVLATKTTRWADESEWRCFIPDGCAEFPVPGTVKRIELGKKMPRENREKIVEWVAGSGTPIYIEG